MRRYVNSKGESLPSVTEIIGIMDKGEALLKWYEYMGSKGESAIKFRDEAAQIGTLAHELIGGFLCGRENNLIVPSYMSQEQISKSYNALNSFKKWYIEEIIDQGKSFKVIEIEKSMVSDIKGYGGTIDLIAKIDDELILIDFKTSSKIKLEHKIQLVAYSQLLSEEGLFTKKLSIIKLGKKDISDWEYFEIDAIGEEVDYLLDLFSSLKRTYVCKNEYVEYCKKNRTRNKKSKKIHKIENKENKENEKPKLTW